MPQAHVYRDLDPLGKGEWYGYVSSNGHIVRNFGPFPTERDAIDHGQSQVGGTSRVLVEAEG
ncbi:hypothetical protein [Azospirillum sp. SYSU D00513]|uniref:hypothetical protein n=1 Tax=Azospirillum sp. SYSU D00513 TaxID=2812561 RepID=UPI001A9581A2|nr:hypothetical protein [Azospirillum sp. SYSU D00513]